MPSVFDVYSTATPVDWAPATEEAEVVQNVRFIMTTLLGTMPLNRGLGLDPGVVDAPANKARAILMTSLVSAIHGNEPRARVIEINLAELDALNGHVKPMVRIEVQ